MKYFLAYIVVILALYIAVDIYKPESSVVKLVPVTVVETVEIPCDHSQLEKQISQLTDDLHQALQKVERLAQENQAYKDYIEGFWWLMEEEYNFTGHNELYERTH